MFLSLTVQLISQPPAHFSAPLRDQLHCRLPHQTLRRGEGLLTGQLHSSAGSKGWAALWQEATPEAHQEDQPILSSCTVPDQPSKLHRRMPFAAGTRSRWALRLAPAAVYGEMTALVSRRRCAM